MSVSILVSIINLDTASLENPDAVNIESWPRRHPRNCKFDDNCQRCKLCSLCSFAHRALENGVGASGNESREIEERLAKLENLMKEKEKEISFMNEKVKNLEEKNMILEQL